MLAKVSDTMVDEDDPLGSHHAQALHIKKRKRAVLNRLSKQWSAQNKRVTVAGPSHGTGIACDNRSMAELLVSSPLWGCAACAQQHQKPSAVAGSIL